MRRLFLFLVPLIPLCAQPVQLTPTKSLDLRPLFEKTFRYPVVIGATISTPDHWYLLMDPATGINAPQAVVALNWDGTLHKLVEISEFRVERWLQPVGEGSPDLLVWRPPSKRFNRPEELLYRVRIESGQIEKERIAHPMLRRGIGRADNVWLPGNPLRPAGWNSLEGTLLLDAERRVSLSAPEVRVPQRPSHGRFMDVSLAADERAIFAIATGYRLDDGAVVVKFNETGERQTSYRCPLAQNERMLPSLVAKNGSILYVADRHGLVAACQLPGR